MVTNDDFLGNSGQKKAETKWYCEKCDYSTCYKSKWNRHIKTKKHNGDYMVTNDDSLGNSGQKKAETKWQCICGRHYSYKQGYYRHKKTCTYTPPLVETETQNQIVSNNIDKDALILELLKKMSEQQEQLNKQNEVIGDLVHRVGNNNTVNTNSHNINLYLNTHCKDAMSIQAFASQLAIDIGKQPQLLCNSKDHKPLCDFISEKMTVLDQTARPVHSHKKTMYLKDEAKGWNKDTKGDAANTVIGAAKKADLDKLPSLYPTLPTNEKQQEVYLNTVSDLMGDVSKKDKEEFEKMDCIGLDIE
jgi:hypothetical protein